MTGGVYMIVAGDRIIYVGQTKRDFETRFKEHKRAVEGDATSYRVHELIRQYKGYGVRPYLVPLYYAKGDEDLFEIKRHFIDLFKPIGN